MKNRMRPLGAPQVLLRRVGNDLSLPAQSHGGHPRPTYAPRVKPRASFDVTSRFTAAGDEAGSDGVALQMPSRTPGRSTTTFRCGGPSLSLRVVSMDTLPESGICPSEDAGEAPAASLMTLADSGKS